MQVIFAQMHIVCKIWKKGSTSSEPHFDEIHFPTVQPQDGKKLIETF